jgi:hypothetical protein
MSILGGKKRIGVFFGALILASSARAQDRFVLPWVETPPTAGPVLITGDQENAPTTASSQTQRITLMAPIQQTTAVQKRSPEEEMGLLLQLTPPDPARLFQFESEEKVRQRIREDLKDVLKVEFPPSPETPPVFQPTPRIWPYLVATAAPSYVCYKRLWFEQSNSERYGWDFGVLQPGIAAGVFYTDLALLPLHWVLDPCRWYDCSAGQCLPGDPVPLLWNPVLGK